MTFVVSSTELQDYLQFSCSIICSKSGIPVLDSIMFSLEEHLLSSEAMDMKVDLESNEGVFAISAKLLLDLNGILSDEDSQSFYRERIKAERIHKSDFLFDLIIFQKIYRIKNSPQISDGPLHQRRNRNERSRKRIDSLWKGGELRKWYDAYCELFRDRHRRRITKEIHIDAESAEDIFLTVKPQRSLSLLLNLNPEA